MFKEFDQRGEGEGKVEKKSAPIQESQKPHFTQEELRDRYEGDRRSFLANEAWLKRKSLRESEKSQAEELLKGLHQTEEYLKESEESKKKMTGAENDAIYMHSIAPRRQAMESLRNQQESRGFFKKIQYRFKADPLNQELEKLKQEIQQEESRITENTNLLERKLQEDTAYLDSKKEKHNEIALDNKELFLRKRKSLLEDVRGNNRASKEGIIKTLESLENGDLDIAKLAQESNALVVHTIPLEGWEMANTSMNNTLVDTKSMSSQEKISTIVEKQPDLSASIISAGESIEGQGLMYPFGVILSGTLIASYDRDAGLIVKDDARIAKPEYGSTLQTNTIEMFSNVAHQGAKGDRRWNESIVHKPNVKALFVDEEKLLQEHPHDMLKVLAYAQEHYSTLPLYIRKKDGIYTKDGKKVTAEEIYG
jgi:hypothetical protein